MTLKGASLTVASVLALLAYLGPAASTSTASSPSNWAGLPTEAMARTVLNTTHRHREWINVPDGAGGVRTYIVYPERADTAPVVFLDAPKQGASDWIRAVADQAAAEGYIAVVPDLLSGRGPGGGDGDSFRTRAAVASALERLAPADVDRRTAAVRRWALSLPPASGESAEVRLTPGSGWNRINVVQGADTAVFQSKGREWREAIAYLNDTFENRPVQGRRADMPEDHSAHMQMAQAAAPRPAPAAGPPGAGAPRGYPFGKLATLPAGIFTAKSTLNHSDLRREWVDIPLGAGKLHMWVEYPKGDAKAPFVLVMQQAPGLDEWQRAIADQLALEGFFVVAPDLYSGLGPNGGNYDSFEGVDAAMRSMARLTPDEMLRRYKAAYAWGMAQPRANGKSATIGFCMGGGQSFAFAGEVPGLNAAVVFYGGAPDEALMAKIKAPVIGFYGENDERVTATAAPAAEKMKALGKSFEYHVYPRATHAFLMFQDMGGNGPATADSWPRATAFLKQHLM